MKGHVPWTILRCLFKIWKKQFYSYFNKELTDIGKYQNPKERVENPVTIKFWIFVSFPLFPLQLNG